MTHSATLTRLALKVVDTARQEDLLLRRVGQGIFLVPELAFVYAVGRSIASDANEIFGTPKVRWLPESKIGTSGRTDLTFEVENQATYALEFKRGGTSADYIRDLRKLSALDASRFERVFCALIDSWPHEIESNPRIQAVESCGVMVERLTESFDFFATLHSGFKKQLCCVVAIWRVCPDLAGISQPLPTV